MSPAKAFTDLTALIATPPFQTRTLPEKLAVFYAIGSTQQELALQMFAKMLAERSLLHRARVKEDKMLAVSGLAAMPSIPSFKAPQAVVEEKGSDSEVVMAARKALFNMKKTLFGDQPDEKAQKKPEKAS